MHRAESSTHRNERQNIMTTETRVNLASTPVAVNVFKPIAAGTYEFELGDASVKVPGDAFKDATETVLKTPYIAVQLKAFGEGLPEGGRKYTHNLYIGCVPGTDGILNYARENGLIAMFGSLGATPPEIGVVTLEKTNKDGVLITADHLNPMEIVQALNNLRGERCKGRIKIKTETYAGKTQDKNELTRFYSREG